MKKIKFMLAALIAIFGFNSAMATELIHSTQYTNNGYQYEILSINTAAKTGTVAVRSTNWTVGNADVTKITIQSNITLNVKGEISATPFEGVVKFDVVEIQKDAFKNLDQITTIEFVNTTENPCNITNIAEGAFAGTKIANLDLTPTKITKLNKLFEDANTSLKSVKFPATLTEVVDYALQHCYALGSIDAQASTDLVSLGKNCFGDNVVETLDLSKTKVTTLENTPFVGKTGESGEKNKTLKHLILPPTLTITNKGLANLYNLEDVNLQDTKITAVYAGDFENDKSLTSLEFPKTLVNIRAANMFKGCASLATMKICYDALSQVGDGTNPFFVEASTGDGSLSALKTLEFFTTDATTYNFKAEINANAFGNCTGITSVKIAAGDDITSDGTKLQLKAIALSNEAASTVVMGNLKTAPQAGFIAGPTAATVAATVTIGEIATAQAQTAGIVSGNIGTFTVGKLSAALNVPAIGQAETIVFGGDIATALTATSMVANNRLTTINFGSVKIADAANIIPATAFNETYAPKLTAISWTPVIDDDNPAPTADIFNQAAFGTASVDAAAKITFSTVPEVAALYPLNTSDPIVDDDLFNVIFKFVSPDVFEAIKVYGPADAVVYVGYFNAPAASNYYIEKKQGDAIITVYSAFVDASDNKIYMDPLMIVDGKFVVQGGQVVVVRSSTGDDVKAYKTDLSSTMRYPSVGAPKPFNELLYTETAISADELGTKYYDHGQYVYYLQNPKTATGINFQILGQTQYLFAKAVYVVKAGVEAGRLEVVWLDGANDATAIQAIQKKNASVSDAIYNLAGQRVDASYKGVVIKNGKKYIQK